MRDITAVSVIIPAYNAARFIPDAIESVLPQLLATDEIVVIDDGSTDATAEVVQRFEDQRVRYVYQPNRGPGAARNTGIALANAEIVGCLDADDLWAPKRLRQQLELLQCHPEVGFVKGLTQVLELAPGGRFETVGQPFLFANFGGSLYRRSLFERVGPIDPSLRFSEDIDWLLRAREDGIRMETLQQVCQYHRRHGNNLTTGRSPQEMSMLKVMKMAIDRKRKGGS
ncbi:MAG: glycosyltransferase family 2 protein [Desulfuromonas sp.]|nr:MAG: glycosyltransferase family 2 protein [Desulfuromonas sp.]